MNFDRDYDSRVKALAHATDLTMRLERSPDEVVPLAEKFHAFLTAAK